MSDGTKYRKESNLSFNEFENREYADWKRIRSAVEHENALINYRQTWLLTSQAFLLTAFGSLLVASEPTPPQDDFSPLLHVIPVVGISVCVILQRAINAAEDYLKELDQWWYYKLSLKQDTYPTQRKAQGWKAFSWDKKKKRTELINNNIKEHPPIQGWTGRGLDRVLHYPVTPVLFIILWLIIFGFVFLDNISVSPQLLYKILEYLAVIGIFYSGLLVISRFRE